VPSEETRYIAYERLILLKDGALRSYLENQKTPKNEADECISLATQIAAQYHALLFADQLQEMESQSLLTPFYRTVLD